MHLNPFFYFLFPFSDDNTNVSVISNTVLSTF